MSIATSSSLRTGARDIAPVHSSFSLKVARAGTRCAFLSMSTEHYQLYSQCSFFIISCIHLRNGVPLIFLVGSSRSAVR